jgi:parallel beta-helix repeat protein
MRSGPHLTRRFFLAGCQVRGGSCGIKVQESAGVIMRFCDVRDSKEHGVYVAKQGWISIEKSHIFSCQCGVLVGQLGSQASLRETDIDTCSQVGVMVYSSAAVLLEACTVHRNGIAGVCLSAGARGVLSKNKIEGNGQVGVMVVEKSAASINDNALRGNSVWSIYVAKCCVSRVAARDNSVDTRHIPLEKEATGTDAEDATAPIMPRELVFSMSPSPLSPDSKSGDDHSGAANAPAGARPMSDFTRHDSWRPSGVSPAEPLWVDEVDGDGGAGFP